VNPQVGLLTVGDELLDGSILDSNGATIAVALHDIGLKVVEKRSVGDDHERIAASLSELAATFPVVIVTGGLGTTSDDLTAAACAKAFDRPCVESQEALAQIERFFAERDRDMHPDNRRSACLPQGAEPLPNRVGVAPGVHLRIGGSDLFLLPGVPVEMAVLLHEQVVPRLRRRFALPPRPRQRILSLFGLSEPETETLLATLPRPAEVSVAYNVAMPLVHVKLRVDDPQSEPTLADFVAQAKVLFGEQVVAEDGRSVAATVAELLTAAGKTLALAESCTGGMIAAQLTDLPGASAFLERGAVTYANRAKHDWLQVPQAVLDGDGAVSDPCARAMAAGIRLASGSDYGLAVTGIAGPDGGSEEKPVGTVFIALAAADDTVVERHRFGGDRQQVRKRTAVAALALLQRHLRRATG